MRISTFTRLASVSDRNNTASSAERSPFIKRPWAAASLYTIWQTQTQTHSLHHFVLVVGTDAREPFGGSLETCACKLRVPHTQHARCVRLPVCSVKCVAVRCAIEVNVGISTSAQVYARALRRRRLYQRRIRRSVNIGESCAIVATRGGRATIQWNRWRIESPGTRSARFVCS